MKKIYSFILLFLLLVPLFSFVSIATDIYSDNFDDDTQYSAPTSDWYTSSSAISQSNKKYYVLQLADAISSPNVLYDYVSARDAYTWGSLFFDVDMSYINQISFYAKLYSCKDAGGSKTVSYIRLCNETNVTMLYIRQYGDNSLYVDTFNTGLSRNVWYKFVIRRVSSSLVNVSIYNTTNALKWYNDVSLSYDVWENIDRLSLYVYRPDTPYGSSAYIYFDDLVLEHTSSYSSVPSCDNQIGTITTQTHHKDERQYIYYIYNVPTQCYINNFYLAVYKDMIDAGANEYSFRLKINQYDLGSASDIIQISEDYYLVCWNGLNLQIFDDQIAIMLKSLSTHDYGGETYYWDVAVYNGDLDNDGYHVTYFINDDVFWTNFNSQYVTQRSYGVSEDSYPLAYDLVYKMCISSLETGVVHDQYSDSLTVYPTSLSLGNYVTIAYTLASSSMGYDNYLVIKNPSNSTVVNQYLATQTGSYKFYPTTTGTYNVSIVRNGDVITTETFTTTGSLPSTYVYTEGLSGLALSGVGEQFTIYYSYPYTSYDGVIRIKSGETTISEFNIEKNTTSSITTYLYNEGIYQVVMYINKNGTLYQVASCQHVVISSHETGIFVDDTSINIDEEIEIYGFHNHLGNEIYVRDNGNIIRYVGDNTTFDFHKRLTYAGNHNISLALRMGNTWIVLDYVIVTVSGEEIPTEGISEDTFNFYMGLAIVVILTFMGIGISSKLSDKDTKFLVTVIFLTIGIITAVFYGLFPMWTAFLFGIILSIYLVRKVIS